MGGGKDVMVKEPELYNNETIIKLSFKDKIFNWMSVINAKQNYWPNMYCKKQRAALIIMTIWLQYKYMYIYIIFIINCIPVCLCSSTIILRILLEISANF